MAPKQAHNIGMSWVKLAVSSMTRMIPVTGALTTAVKKAAIATMAKVVGVTTAWGRTNPQSAENSSPIWAPRTSIGANRPPGVPAA